MSNINLVFGNYRLTGNGSNFYITEIGAGANGSDYLRGSFNSLDEARLALSDQFGIPPATINSALDGEPYDSTTGGGGSGGSGGGSGGSGNGGGSGGDSGAGGTPGGGPPDPFNSTDLAQLLQLILQGSGTTQGQLLGQLDKKEAAGLILNLLISEQIADRNYQRDQATLDAAEKREAEKQTARRNENSAFITGSGTGEGGTGLLDLSQRLYRYQGDRSPGNASARTGYGLGPVIGSTRGQDQVEPEEPTTFGPIVNPRGDGQPSGGAQQATGASALSGQQTGAQQQAGGTFSERYARLNQQRGSLV